LRRILGAYGGKDPGEIVLRENAAGKPELADGTLHFNVSHSGNLALIAICGQAVGVDIEYMGYAAADIEEVAQASSHTTEWSLWRRLKESERCELFCRLWTRKEAFGKALGTGLNEPFSRLYFVPQFDSSALCVCKEGAPGGTEQFFSYDIAAPSYLATISPANERLSSVERREPACIKGKVQPPRRRCFIAP
jgi:4'-phosphopantetheinyl transferase